MRTLKKTLALVLALVMCFGIFAVSASAATIDDFSDVADIDATFAESVNVLTQLGIIAGMDDGSFSPDATLTREQGAKLITYMMLGATAADAMKASSAPFSDVPATRWSAGYIAYCANEGLINGYGNGKFGPADTLTGLQFAKMLLSAVGYGANDEFVGDNWSINVAKTALKTGVFTGNTAGANNEPCTREAACLYTFNTLSSIAQVTYSQLLGEYTTGGALNTQTGSTLGEDLYDLYKTDPNGALIGKTTNGGKHYNTLNANLYNYNDVVVTAIGNVSVYYSIKTADIGRTGYVWVVADRTAIDGYKVVSAVHYTDKVLATVFSASDTTLYPGPYANWANPSSFSYVAPNNSTVIVYLNGTMGGASNQIVTGCTSTIIDSDNDGDFDKVITTRKNVAVLTGDVKTKTGTTGTTVNVPGVTGSTYVSAKGYEGLKNKDVVLYYVGPDNVYYIEKPKTVTGQLTNTGSFLFIPTFTFAGGFYMAANGLTGYDVSALSANKDAEVFIGDGGYLVYGRNIDPTTTKDVVFVLVAQDTTGTIVPVHQAQLLFQDGTRKVVETVDDYSALSESFVTATLNTTTNQYTLQAVSSTVGAEDPQSGSTGLTVNNGTAVFASGFVGNNNTVFVVRDTKGTAATADDVWSTYTGISALPSGSAATVFAFNDDDGNASFVYISGTMAGINNTVFITSWYTYSSFAATSTTPAYNQFSAIVDGAVVQIKVLSGVPVFADGLYEVSYNSQGYISTMTAVNDEMAPPLSSLAERFENGVGTNKAVAGTIKFGSDVYTYTSSTKVWLITNGAAAAGTIEDIATDATDKFQILVKSGTELVAYGGDGTLVLDTVYIFVTNNAYTEVDYFTVTRGAVVTNSGAPLITSGAGTASNPYIGTASATATAGVATIAAHGRYGGESMNPGSFSVTLVAGPNSIPMTFSVTSETGVTAYYQITLTVTV